MSGAALHVVGGQWTVMETEDGGLS